MTPPLFQKRHLGKDIDPSSPMKPDKMKTFFVLYLKHLNPPQTPTKDPDQTKAQFLALIDIGQLQQGGRFGRPASFAAGVLQQLRQHQRGQNGQNLHGFHVEKWGKVIRWAPGSRPSRCRNSSGKVRAKCALSRWPSNGHPLN